MEPLYLTDREWIVIALGLLYLTECFVWLPANAVVFVRSPLTRHALLRSWTFLANQVGGLFISSPWPGGTALICQSWPLNVSPQGICSNTRQWPQLEGAASESFAYCWEEIETIEAIDRNIQINGKDSVRVCAPLLARQIVAMLTAWKSEGVDARERLIEQALAKCTDAAHVRDRLEQSRQQAALIRRLAVAMFVAAFVISPMCLWCEFTIGYRVYASIVLIVLLLSCHVAIAIAARGMLWGTNEYNEAERWSKYIALWLSPAATMRAYDTLCQTTVVSSHPLTVASVVCSSAEFECISRKVLLDVRHSAPRAQLQESDKTWQIEHWFLPRLQKCLAELVSSTGACVTSLLAEPMSMDESAQSYCPRCDGQYTLAVGVCHNCDGVELRPFTQSRSTSM